jgi:hypothetical protein
MKRIAAFAALGAAVLVGSAGAACAQEGVFMKDLLGNLGVIPEAKPRIEYRERPALVVPPKASLPPPVTTSVEARNPAWPNDPDVVEERGRVARARLPAGTDERSRLLNESNATLSVEELRRGRRAGAGIPTEPEVRPNENHRDAYWISPDVLRKQRLTGTGDEPLVAGVEPKRKALTDPPTGFRAPSDKAAIRTDFEPVERKDDADPIGFVRQQNGR